MNKKNTIFIAAMLSICLTGCGNDLPDSETSSVSTSVSTATISTNAVTEKASETTAMTEAVTSNVTNSMTSTEKKNEATAETTSAGSNETKNTPASGTDNSNQELISNISGVWYEDGSTTYDPRVLTVNTDGTFSLENNIGSTVTGTVKVESEEHPDGTETLWFNFYNSTGEFWAGFPCPDGPAQSDIYSGQDGALHFSRTYTLPKNDDDAGQSEARFKGDDYLGVWYCDRCTLTVDPEGDGYNVQIQWANSAADGTFWNYHCVYSPETWHLSCTGSGIRTDYSYGTIEEPSQERTDQIRYSDGSAEFWLSDDGDLYWNDYTEGRGNDLYFTK